jgi:hypothetical protein
MLRRNPVSAFVRPGDYESEQSFFQRAEASINLRVACGKMRRQHDDCAQSEPAVRDSVK